MILTRSQLHQLNEAVLRTEVLIPLFRTMGFHDVFHHHGGPLEQGKDIVMWKPDDLGTRINYAVVVKAGAINGRAQGAGSAGEVATQIQQCFGTPFRDPRTTELQTVDRCWVVASGKIPTEAINAVSGPLATAGLTRVTRFINGDEFWQLLEKHLPEKTAWEQFSKAHHTLQGLVPGHHLSVTLDGESAAINLTPKEGAPAPDPLMLTFQLDFTSAEHGQAARENYREFIRTGSPLKLGPEVIRSIDIPEPLRRLYGVRENAKYGFHFTPLPLGERGRPMRLERICEDGTRAALECLEMECVQVGTEEMTITNERQKAPWIVRLKVDPRNGNTRFAFQANVKGCNVKQAAECLRFVAALAKPGALRTYDYLTGLESSSEPATGAALADGKSAPSQETLELLEKLCAIQQRTQTLLRMPEEISPEEIYEINTVYAAVTVGRIALNPETTLMTGLMPADKLLKNRKNFSKPGALLIRPQHEQTRNLLGVEINLGPMEIRCDQAVLVEPDLERLFAPTTVMKGNGKAKRSIKLGMRAASADTPIWLIYPKWLPDAAP